MIRLLDDLKRAYTCVIFLGHGREASLSDYLKLSIESLDHFFNVVWTSVHKSVGQKSTSFKLDLVVHFLVLVDLLELFSCVI